MCPQWQPSTCSCVDELQTTNPLFQCMHLEIVSPDKMLHCLNTHYYCYHNCNTGVRHYLWAQSQGHHTIDHLEERGTERGSARRSSLKGQERAIIIQLNIGTISKAALGNLLRDRVKRFWAFLSAWIPSWTELNWTTGCDTDNMFFCLFSLQELVLLCWAKCEAYYYCC